MSDPREAEDKTLREAVLDVCARRGWSLHWTHRSAYLHLEAAELAEAVRGKRGNTLAESADVLITLLALSPHDLREIEGAAWRKLIELRECPPYAGEELAPIPPQESVPTPETPRMSDTRNEHQKAAEAVLREFYRQFYRRHLGSISDDKAMVALIATDRQRAVEAERARCENILREWCGRPVSFEAIRARTGDATKEQG